MMQWKVPGLSGTLYATYWQSKERQSSFLTDIVHKTKSSTLTFTKKGGKICPQMGELWNSTIWFAYFPVQTFTTFIISVRDYTLESLLLISIPRVFLCVILLVHPSIIWEKTPNSYFPHRIFVFLPPLSFKLICQESLGSPI